MTLSLEMLFYKFPDSIYVFRGNKFFTVMSGSFNLVQFANRRTEFLN